MKEKTSYYDKKELPKTTDTFRLRQGKGVYLPSEELKRAVDVALLLNKPLLLTGLPGTGKTDLAYHLAQHFKLGDPLVFHTQTTSMATDLLYRYNSLAHFQYSRHQPEPLSPAEIEARFIDYVALGAAIRDSAQGKKRVVLIDEIDKAPRDLPNDILDIVENMRFQVPELKTRGKDARWKHEGDPNHKPLVILTSNSEKALPEPFLRRCLFFHISLPTDEELRAILRAKLGLPYEKDEEWNAFIHFFKAIQEKVRGKKPATAELILWTWWVHQQGITPAMLAGESEWSDSQRALLKSSYSILAKDNEDWRQLQQQEDLFTQAPD